LRTNKAGEILPGDHPGGKGTWPISVDNWVLTSGSAPALKAAREVLGGTPDYEYNNGAEKYRLITDTDTLNLRVVIEEDDISRYQLYNSRSRDAEGGGALWMERLCDGESCKYQPTPEQQPTTVPCVCSREIIEQGALLSCTLRFRLKVMFDWGPPGTWILDSGAETSEEGIFTGYELLKAYTVAGMPEATLTRSRKQKLNGETYHELKLLPVRSIEDLKAAFAAQQLALDSGDSGAATRLALENGSPVVPETNEALDGPPPAIESGSDDDPVDAEIVEED
jgi:hypothetical protein